MYRNKENKIKSLLYLKFKLIHKLHNEFIMERRRAGEGDNEELSQEARINRGINLDK